MPDYMTRQDADRLHQRLDESGAVLTQVQIAVARIEQKIELAPKVPGRPCPDFVSHVAEHKKQEEETRKTWKSILMQMAGPAIVGAGASIAAWLGLRGH